MTRKRRDSLVRIQADALAASAEAGRTQKRPRAEWITMAQTVIANHTEQSREHHEGVLHGLNATLRAAGYAPATMAEIGP